MGNPWWYDGCKANAVKAGYKLCHDSDPNKMSVHCSAKFFKNYIEKYCTCQPPYLNGCIHKKPNCCSYTAESPVPILSLNCACCCGCFANNTPVAFSQSQYKAIEEFEIGEMVYVAEGVSLDSWEERPVRFSSGTGEYGGPNVLIKVTFGTPGEADFLYVNRAQLFLVSGRVFKSAATLVPGVDKLITPDGDERPVLSLTVGSVAMGVHHIATTSHPAKSVKGHIMLAKGVACGDWAMQVGVALDHSRYPMFKGFENLPEFGTPEYAEAYPDVTVSEFRAAATLSEELDDDHLFESFNTGPRYPIPQDAQAFFTEEQSWDVYTNGPAAPPSSNSGAELVAHLFKLFGGFYKGVRFLYDERSPLPNAFSFEEFGEKFIVLTGGLVRLDDVTYDALSVIIARQLAVFYGGAPLNSGGYSCTGTADYAGITGIMINVWFLLSSVPISTSGVEQIEKVFGYVSPENRQPEPENRCMNVSIGCRVSAMRAALQTMPLPHCAGGPPDPKLEVLAASGKAQGQAGTAKVIFNLALDKKTAVELGNYDFEPPVSTTKAEMDPSDPMSVVITGDFEKDCKYSVSVFGVLSEEGEPLVPGENNADFTVT